MLLLATSLKNKRCSGKTWREQVGREVGGGIGMGKTCEPKAFSFQCMTELTTNKTKQQQNNNNNNNNKKTKGVIPTWFPSV